MPVVFLLLWLKIRILVEVVTIILPLLSLIIYTAFSYTLNAIKIYFNIIHIGYFNFNQSFLLLLKNHSFNTIDKSTIKLLQCQYFHIIQYNYSNLSIINNNIRIFTFNSLYRLCNIIMILQLDYWSIIVKKYSELTTIRFWAERRIYWFYNDLCFFPECNL